MIEDDDNYYRNTIVYRHLIKEDQIDDLMLMKKMEPWVDSQVKTLQKIIMPGSGASILEIGSGYGWLVQKLRELGYTADGIEVNHEQRRYAKERSEVNLYGYNLLLESPPEIVNKYDFVCMFHLLEHISIPVDFIISVLKALKPGGKIIIEVPNNDDYIKKVSDAYSKFTFKRQHICYYTENTIKAVLEKAGLHDISISGIHRYSIENALHWARYNAPYIDSYQIDVPKSLTFVNDYYKNYLQDRMISENILAVASK